jgi:hypothetical protein
MFDRINRALKQALDPDKVGAAPSRQPTLETLLPGDVVSLWDGGDCIVEAVLECREELNRRETRWRLNLLDGGRVLEVAPDGNVLYGRSVVLYQESTEFETLTCDPEHGGVLKAFEARVRNGTAARNPVLFEHGGRTFRIISTGIFDARPAGGFAYPRADVWRDINPSNPADNVYFELEPTGEDTEDRPESVVLGIWTSHIALLFGTPLKSADVQTIYPRSEEEGGTG